MKKRALGRLLLIGFLGWTALPSHPVAASVRHLIQDGRDSKQSGDYRLALKAPGGRATGISEEEAPPKPPAQEQPGGEAVTPGKTAPPALPPYKPSERIPADQAVDFPADI